MKRQKLGILALLSFACASAAFAADGLPAPGKLTIGSDVRVNVLLDAYYQYNFSKPPVATGTATASNPVTNPQITNRSYDRVHRQFNLNEATVGFSHNANPVGFNVRLGTGTQMEVLNGSDSTYRNVRDANMTWADHGMSFTVGRFDSGFGLEGDDSVDNWNYSRSLSYTLLEPAFLTGVKGSYDLGGGLTVTIGGANGVNRFVDNNRGGTYTLQVVHSAKETEMGMSYFTGPEQSLKSSDWRHHINVYGKHEYNSTTNVGFDATMLIGVNETVSGTAGAPTKNAMRWAAGLYGNHSFWADHWCAVRAEFLQDKQGAVFVDGGGTRMWSFTATHRYMVTRNLSVWAEARWDNSNYGKFVNQDGGTTKTNQVTALVAATFAI